MNKKIKVLKDKKEGLKRDQFKIFIKITNMDLQGGLSIMSVKFQISKQTLNNKGKEQHNKVEEEEDHLNDYCY